MRVGYHASHEQFAPSELLELVQRAERAGFRHAMCSDHLAPFSLHQGQSGFAWSWLGAAMATTSLTFGTVNAPGQRYHPAVIAQGIATLAEMFEGRFWTAFGSGQLINEHVTGERWPSKDERNARLVESVEIIRGLLAGETVSRCGHVQVSEARLYSRSKTTPLLFGAGITPETAAWVSGWADGLITVYQPDGKLRTVIDSFRRGGGARKPVYLQVQHAFAPTYEEALAGACDQWAQSVLTSRVMTDLALPEQIDDAAAMARPEDVAERVRVSNEPRQHLEWLREYEDLGVEAVYLHNVTRHQSEFIDMCGEHILPHFAT